MHRIQFAECVSQFSHIFSQHHGANIDMVRDIA